VRIGDQISVLDENLSGIITSVNGNIVVFKDEYGFTYQYPKEKLVPKNASIYENIEVIRKAEPRKVISKKHDKNPLILDLHFHNLVKNPTDYDSFERLFIQKEKLIETISFCRKNHLKLFTGSVTAFCRKWFGTFLKARRIWIFTIKRFCIINRGQ